MHSMHRETRNVLAYTLAALLLLLAICVELRIFAFGGVGWDFVSHYLNAKAMLSGNLYGAAAANRYNFTVQTHAIHYGKERSPLSQTIFYAVLALIYTLGLHGTGIGIGAYIVVLYVLLGCIAVFSSRLLKVNPLLVFSALLSPYMLRYLVIYNSAEIISLALLLAYVAALYKKSYWAGAIIAIASLAKYTNIIFIPMLLFLDRRELRYALLMLVLFTLPWLVFSQIFFYFPFMSYLMSFAESQASLPTRIHSLAFELSYMLFYPLAIAAGALAYSLLSGKRIRIGKNGMRLLRISASMLVLGALLFAFVYRNTAIPSRFGYAIYLSLSLLAVVLVEEVAGRKAVYAVFAFSAVSLLAMNAGVGPGMHLNTASNINSWGMLSNNEFLTNVSDTLARLNLTGCDVVTNAWTWLRYYNISAYEPYYYDALSYNSSFARMPIVIFHNTGVPANQVRTYNITKQYSYGNFSILLPANYICSRS